MGSAIHKREDFTLIELLVVTALIAVLIAILKPPLQIAKENATGVVCLSNHRSTVKTGRDRDRNHPGNLTPETAEGFRDLYRLQKATFGRLDYQPYN